ncbi:MAG: S41 family peptidase [Planctomycetaceae bacterium]|nr:S41 family peptidase [Planctomycetaceae bacterium]
MKKLLPGMFPLALLGLALSFGWVVGISAAHAQDEETYELMRVFVDTFEEIDRNYVTDVDRRELIEAAIRGMLAELDPYSDFISPEDLDNFNEAVEQEFGGVGIRVNFNRAERAIEVMTPIPGSPAYKAGIQAGDRVVGIEGKAVKDFEHDREIDTAVKMLRGAPGEEVTVTVQRKDSEKTDDIKLVRELIQLDTVLGYKHNDDGSWNFFYDDEQKIGYLRLTHFTRRSADEVRAAVKQQLRDGMQALVLDLRFNPGGLLQAAVEICDMFLEDGVIVSTEGRNSRPRNWTAKRFGTFEQFPMAILVNRYSASASEIVSACLQDHDRAVVVGERSWGKGSVQNVTELEDGKSALKLTTAAYHRPSGKNIHRSPKATEADEWGVTPNDGYKLEFSFEQLRDFQRDRRERDILGRTEPYQSEFKDSQLEKAVEYVREQLAGETKPEQPQAKPKEEEKKAAFRLPLFPVQRRNVG